MDDRKNEEPIPSYGIGDNVGGVRDHYFTRSCHPSRVAKMGRVTKSLHGGIDFQNNTPRSLGAVLFDVAAGMPDVLPRLRSPSDLHTGLASGLRWRQFLVGVPRLRPAHHILVRNARRATLRFGKGGLDVGHLPRI